MHIYCTTDTHGKLINKNGNGNLPEYLRNLGRESLLIDCGDILTGDLKSTYFNCILKKSPYIDVINDYHFDVAIVGNHDLDYGIDYLISQAKRFKGEYLCANLYDLNRRRVFRPYAILQKEGVKVGVIGALTGNLSQISAYETSKDVIITRPLEEIKRVVDDIKSKCHIIVVAYHGGTSRDIKTGKVMYYNTGENEAYDIFHEIEDIDVVIYGHMHFLDSGVTGSRAYIQPGHKLNVVGKVEIDPAREKPVISAKNIEITDEKDCPTNVASRVYYTKEEYNSWKRKDIDLSKFRDYLEDSFGFDAYIIRLKGKSVNDFSQSFSCPYGLTAYQLSKEEYKKIKSGLTENKNTLFGEKNTERESVVVISNDSNLPYYRIKEKYIVDVVDRYIYYLNKGDSHHHTKRNG